MRIEKRVVSWTLRIALTAILASSAFAQATRTWISGVGDDANPCSRTAPCKTLAGAISKTAVGGEINNIDSGGFGGVTITNSIVIDLTPGRGGVLVSGTNGLTINNSTGGLITVTLRGLAIDGLGTGLSGVKVTGSSPVTLHVEDSQIWGFTTNGISIAPSATVNVTVARTRISECVGASTPGINADGTNGAVSLAVIDSEIHGCATGLNLLGAAKANVRNSDLSENTTGVSATDTSIGVLDSGTIAYCTTGVTTLAAGATVRLTNMTISDNTTGLAPTAGAIVSFGNNRIKGNTTNGAPTSTLFQN